MIFSIIHQPSVTYAFDNRSTSGLHKAAAGRPLTDRFSYRPGTVGTEIGAHLTTTNEENAGAGLPTSVFFVCRWENAANAVRFRIGTGVYSPFLSVEKEEVFMLNVV